MVSDVGTSGIERGTAFCCDRQPPDEMVRRQVKVKVVEIQLKAAFTLVRFTQKAAGFLAIKNTS